MPDSEAPLIPPEIQAQWDSALEAYKNRKRYNRFDESVLASISDEHLEQALLDYLFDRLEGFNHDHDKTFAGLSPQFRIFFCTWEVEAEVMNGGLNQYFWNSSSQNAGRVPAALEQIGDPVAAELMREAIRIAVSELPEMAKYLKANTLEAFSESYKHTTLNELDTPFCSQAEGFPALRLAYVRSQPTAFVSP
jgi:hypothetical protein